MTAFILFAAVALLAWPSRRAAPPSRSDLPLTLDLVAAALRSGRPVPDALVVVVGGRRSDPLREVARRLRDGADAEDAWQSVIDDVDLGVVARVAVRSSSSGARLAAAFERLAGELRSERAAAATARAHRVGVYAMAPLGLCFLPAFVCVGIVPVVLGIARTLEGF